MCTGSRIGAAREETWEDGDQQDSEHGQAGADECDVGLENGPHCRLALIWLSSAGKLQIERESD